MNDEAHGIGSAGQAGVSVLRPFEPPTPAPLPPIEPSKVVAELPPVVEQLGGDVDETPELPPEFEHSDPLDDVDEVDANEDVEAIDTAEAIEDAEAVQKADDEPTSTMPTVVVSGDEPPPETITLPRKTFLVGLAVLLGAVALFGLLWQTGSDDASDTVAAEEPTPTDAPVDSAPDPAAAVEDDPSLVGADELADAESDLADTAADLAVANAEVAGLEAKVAILEERPPPALDGSRLRRIVVGADAKFVSALPDSVAVVGAFGGVSLIDPNTNRVVANSNVANAATRILRTRSSVWLTNYADQQLIQVDPASNTVVAAFPFVGPDGIDKDGDTLVVASFDGRFVARVNPSDGTILQQVDVGGQPTAVLSHVDHGLWVALFDTGEIVQIDRDSFEVTARVTVGQGPVGISAGTKFLWVTNHDEGTISKVDPVAGELAFTVPVGEGPTESAISAGSVWVTVTDDGSLAQLATSDGAIQTVTPLGGAGAGGGPTGIAHADGTLWIAMQGEQSVVRIDVP